MREPIHLDLTRLGVIVGTAATVALTSVWSLAAARADAKVEPAVLSTVAFADAPILLT